MSKLQRLSQAWEYTQASGSGELRRYSLLSYENMRSS